MESTKPAAREANETINNSMERLSHCAKRVRRYFIDS
jgi:hypothetical protein